MRIVIDFQGAQTESRFRGIGRYTTSLTKAIIRNKNDDDEIILALNGLFPDTIEPIRAEFYDLLPQENIRVWYAPGPVKEIEEGNDYRREVAERIREAFLSSLKPDVILVTSLFEGFGDDAVTSIGKFDKETPVAVIAYDLFPYKGQDKDLTHSLFKDFYLRKIEYFKKATLYLAISNYTARDIVNTLDIDKNRVVNISAAVGPQFKKIDISANEKESILKKFGIKQDFIMYTGGADDRKNIRGLINAFSKLPQYIKKKYQLILVGRMPEENVKEFKKVAYRAGLGDEKLIFTGYVSDRELIKLYNLCKLFVFPSFNEGFGFPPLEAMSCGAPVIVSNKTSLPEVVERKDALFDPYNTEEMATKIEKALTNDSFRESLIKYGLKRAKEFSWDESAKVAIKALKKLENPYKFKSYNEVHFVETGIFKNICKRILILKLDHRGDLILSIPALMKLKSKYPYSKIDIIVGSWNKELAQKLNIFNKIFTLDYFKSESSCPPSLEGITLNKLINSLDCYDIAIDLRRQPDTRFLLSKICAKLKVGYQTFDSKIDNDIDIVIPSQPDEPFKLTNLNSTSISLQMLRIIDSLPYNINDHIIFPKLINNGVLSGDKVMVAIFPCAGNEVKEWGKDNFANLVSKLCENKKIDCVNVYFGSEKEKARFNFKYNKKIRFHVGLELNNLINSLSQNKISIANNSFGAHLSSYIGVPSPSIYLGHETPYEWGPVFGKSYVIYKPVQCSPCHLAKKSDCRNNFICGEIPVDYVYNRALEILESTLDGKDVIPDYHILEAKLKSKNSLLKSISSIDYSPNDFELMEIASAVAKNFPSSTKQLFVDVSELVQRDARTGIQRVARAILKELFKNPPKGYKVEPVYATTDSNGYKYARKFVAKFFGYAEDEFEDEYIDAYPGDVFLGLDLQPYIVPNQFRFLTEIRNRGIKIYFVVYDLLPVIFPEFFPLGANTVHEKWLKTICSFDGAVCISKSVAGELKSWVEQNNIKRLRPFKIGYFHLGSDVENSVPTKGLPEDASEVLSKIRLKISFLMVGTIEPRKGHLQTIKAFERLWSKGFDVNLVIVGKEGWMVSELISKIKTHPELNKRLFWLQGISDEYLEKVYASCKCLIMASEGEGFGLPLIEAARHKIPIIARDIPVFREVAQEYAYYFKNSLEPDVISKAIEDWLILYKNGKHPKSDNMPHITWKESAKRLLDIILNDKFEYTIVPKTKQNS